MARKTHPPEEIVAKLRQVRPKAGRTEVDVLVSQGQAVAEAARGKRPGPARRRACIEHVRRALPVSERRVCAALGRHCST